MWTWLRGTLFWVSLLGFLVFACGDQWTGASFLTSHLARDRSPDVSPEAQAELAAGNNAFAMDFYGVLRDDADGNLFCSPYSISLALAMVYAGARGETEAQMADVLHFTLPQDELHAAFNWLDLDLMSRGGGDYGRPDFTLNVTNGLWGDAGTEFEDAFLDTLAVNYGAGIRLVDFAADPERARQEINAWAEEETEGRITNPLGEGDVDEYTKWMVVNAINFIAEWAYQFEEYYTEGREFRTLDGATVLALTMQRIDHYRIIDGTGFQALQMPYDGRQVAMSIILPDEGAFDAVEEAMSVGGELDETLANLNDAAVDHVHLRVPKFEFETPSLELTRVFETLGLTDPFIVGIADLSGISPEALAIARILHKSFVLVDENGTEAAAVTVVAGDGDGDGDADPPELVEFHVDRPFIFAIHDIPTGTILFLGRVLDPTV